MTQTPRPARRFVSRTRPRLVLGGIAAASMTLSGCGQNAEVENAQFTSVSECTKAGYPSELCQASYSAAVTEQQKSAPAFNSLAQCQEEWGDGSCNQTRRGGSGVFVPFLAGFVLSRAMQRSYLDNGYVNYYGGGYSGSPIYRSRGGSTVTIGKGTGGKTVSTPVNVNTKTVSASGFGGRSMSRSFGG